MKVAFISQYFFPEQFSNNELCQHLAEKGHQVDVVCCVPNYGRKDFFEGYSNRKCRQEHWKGANIWRVWTIPRGKSKISLALNYLVYTFFGSIEALKRLGKADVSFVSLTSPITQAIVSIVLKKVHNVPSVYWVQDIWPESLIHILNIRNKPLIWLMTKGCGWIYRRADLLLVQSEAFVEKMTSFGVSPEKIAVFPNTAPKIFRPLGAHQSELPAEFVPTPGFNILFSGNLGAAQGLDVLLEALSHLKHLEALRCTIVGSGLDEDRLKKRAAEMGLESDRLRFVGRHPEHLMPHFYAHADALFLSLKDTDIFKLTVPYKLQCYMACGKPILASLSGEGARILTLASAGLSSPAEDVSALVTSIQEMVNLSTKQRAQMGENALSYFQTNYSQDLVFKKFSQYLQSVART